MPDETEFEKLHERIRNYLGHIQKRLDIPKDNTDISGYDLFKLTPGAVTETEVQRRHLEATQRFRGGFDRMYGEASREIRSALEQAKAILLDVSKRAAYDRWLEERRRTTEPTRPSPLEQIEMTLDILIRDGSITVSEKTRLLTKAGELGIAASDVENLLRRRGVRTISDAERAEAERRRLEREEAERREREEAERRRRAEEERRAREEAERKRREREEAERRARRTAKARTFRKQGLRFAYIIAAMLVLWFAVRPMGVWLWHQSRQQRVTQQQGGNGATKFTLPANPTQGMTFTNPKDGADIPKNVKNQITFAEIKDKQGYLTIKFKENGKRVGVVGFDNKREFITVKKEDGKVTQINHYYYDITEIGTVDLDGSGNEDVFFVSESWGTGAGSTDLNLINTHYCEVIGLTLQFSKQRINPITKMTTTKNFYEKRFEKERKFLEKLKYEYRYVSEEEADKQKANPKFAYYFWFKENGHISDGRMTINKYKGNCVFASSVTDELTDGDFVYTAYFKAGVVAYDKRNDEHFILYHPDSMYDWPDTLKKKGPYLIIGRSGREVAIVNVENFYLKRSQASIK